MYKNDPREIEARFDSICAETGKAIKSGDTCIYYPSSKRVFSDDSKAAEDFRSWSFDVNVLGNNY